MKKVLFDVNGFRYHPDDLIAALNILKAGETFGEIENSVDLLYASSVFHDYYQTFLEKYLAILDLGAVTIEKYDIDG